MANVNIGKLIWSIDANTKGIDKSVKATEGKMSKFGKTVLAAFSGVALIAAAKKLVSFLNNAGEAAKVQEAAVSRLNAALKATGQASGNALGDLQSFASQMQQLTTVGDETSLGLLQTATNMGLTVDASKTAVQQAIALSKAYGIDLNTALIGVVNTMQGQTSTLTRYIPSLKSATTATERLALLTDEANKAWQVATSEVETATGVHEQLKNALGDTNELIGAMVNERLTPWRSKLLEIVTELNNTRAAQVNLNKAIEGDGSADIVTALEQQRTIVRDIRNGIAEGGTAALKLARQYQVHMNDLPEVLSAQQTILNNLERQVAARLRYGQQSELDRIAAEQAIKDQERQVELLQEIETRRISSAELALGAQAAQNQIAREAYEAENERLAALAEYKEEIRQAEIDAENARHEERINNLQKELEFYSKYTGNVANIFSNLISIQMAGDDELTESKKKNIIALYRLQQAANIAQVIVDTASAIVRQYKDLPLYLAIPASIITAAVGATQIGVIASTPPPALADGGIVPATPGGRTVQVAEGGRDEAIVPLDQGGIGGPMRITVNLDGTPIMDLIQSGLNRREIVVNQGSIA